MENKVISFTLNGLPVSCAVDIRVSLSDLLREEGGCLSVKQGCNLGSCGACTVIVNGETVTSCIYLAVWADGKNILTLEGIGIDGQLAPIQQEFINCGAVQCGFCTPGFIMSAMPLLAETSKPTRMQIRRSIAGNLCRCTGYEHIVDAIEQAYGKSEVTLCRADDPFQGVRAPSSEANFRVNTAGTDEFTLISEEAVDVSPLEPVSIFDEEFFEKENGAATISDKSEGEKPKKDEKSGGFLQKFTAAFREKNSEGTEISDNRSDKI